MTDIDDIDDPETFVRQNKEMLVRILRHSDNSYARACAWAILDAGTDDPEIEQLENELQQLKEVA